MEPVRTASPNSFLALVEKSSAIDTNSKILYQKINEIWKDMSSFLSKVGSHADTVTSMMLLAFFKRHTLLFQKYLETQTAQMQSRRLDFPKDMLIGIQGVYITSLMSCQQVSGDEKVSVSPLNPREERKRQYMLTCVSTMSSLTTIRLFAGFLANRFMLNLEPCPFLKFKVKFQPAFEEELNALSEEDREPLRKIIQEKGVNFEHLQLRYQRHLNVIIYQYMYAITKNMQNIYADAQIEVESIQDWRLNQRELKRKSDEGLQEFEKKLQRTMAVCEKTVEENERLRQDALKALDNNALTADSVVGSHLEMSRDLYEQKEKLQRLVETQSARIKELEDRINAKGLLGRIFT